MRGPEPCSGWTVSLGSAPSAGPTPFPPTQPMFFWVWASPGALGNENILGIKGHDEPILPPQRVLSSGDTNKKEKQPSIPTEVSDGMLPGRQQV